MINGPSKIDVSRWPEDFRRQFISTDRFRFCCAEFGRVVPFFRDHRNDDTGDPQGQVTRLKYRLDVENALFLYGGRVSGPRLSYAAVNRSLCVLEYLADIDSLFIPDDLVIATLLVPDDLARAPTPELPPKWKEYPAPPTLRKIGDRLVLDGQSAILVQKSSKLHFSARAGSSDRKRS